MRYFKIGIAVLVVGIFCLAASSAVQAQAERDEEQICSDMTYAQLVDIIVKVLDLPLPENFDELTGQQQFEAHVNILVENGIPDFEGYEPNGKVTRGFAAEVLIKALKVPQEFASIDDKIAYLANLGYISRGGVEEILTDCEEDILEAYTPAPLPDLPDAPPKKPEPPASDVQ